MSGAGGAGASTSTSTSTGDAAFELKPLQKAAVPAALEKARHYRLLNEPDFAESICLDILAVEPENQAALTMYLLTLSDQFEGGPSDAVTRARAVLPRLTSAYDRAYFAGLISERWGHACLQHSAPGSGSAAYSFLREAMDLFEKARPLSAAGNDDPALRYNTCVRTLLQNRLEPPEPDPVEVAGDA